MILRREVSLTVKLPAPWNYMHQESRIDRRRQLLAYFGPPIRRGKRYQQVQREGEGQGQEVQPTAQVPRITFDTRVGEYEELDQEHDGNANSHVYCLQIANDEANADRYLMNTTHPIPTSALSYFQIEMESLRSQPPATNRFISGLYTVAVVDQERRYVHMLVSNLAPGAICPDRPPIRFLPYQEPAVGPRRFYLTVITFSQPFYITLDSETVKIMQCRRSYIVGELVRAYRLRTVGWTMLCCGAEAPPVPPPEIAPVA